MSDIQLPPATPHDTATSDTATSDTATSDTATSDTATSDDGVFKELGAAIQRWVGTR
ncbi:hypothetical protein [Streptomyces sp. 5-6(2022)]|uniref:hypothetical protein n=1 Tax=Streptomyces sp. 5-6(2022) TaxID=2936510 RepID=UPI0023B923F3|nr:hypothetical protein [Streptomyces sp. 5-6(2022)]